MGKKLLRRTRGWNHHQPVHASASVRADRSDGHCGGRKSFSGFEVQRYCLGMGKWQLWPTRQWILQQPVYPIPSFRVNQRHGHCSGSLTFPGLEIERHRVGMGIWPSWRTREWKHNQSVLASASGRIDRRHGHCGGNLSFFGSSPEFGRNRWRARVGRKLVWAARKWILEQPVNPSASVRIDRRDGHRCRV